MALFDGSTFTAIDEDAFGDGIQDASSLPFDTFIENQLNNNISWLKRRNKRFCYQYPGAFESRFHTSAGERGSIFHLLLPVTRLTSRVLIECAAYIEGGEVTVQMWHVGGELGSKRTWQSQSSPSSGGPTMTSYFAWVDVDPEQEGMALIVVKMSSKAGRLALPTGGVPGRVGYDFEKMGNVGYDIGFDSSIAGLHQQLDDERWSITSTVEGQSREYLNNLSASRYNPRDDDMSSVRRTLTVFPDAHPAGDGKIGNAHPIANLGSINPRGLLVEIREDEARIGSGWTPKHQSTMRPNQPVLANDVIEHQRNLQHIYEQPRVHAIGPNGHKYVPPTTLVGDGIKAERWTKVYGDEGRRPLDDQIILPVAASGTTRFTWYGLVCCAHLVRSNEEAWMDPSVWQENLGIAEWDTTMSIQSPVGDGGQALEWGDIPVLASSTTSHVLDMWAADHQAQIPLLAQLYWSYFDDGPGGQRRRLTAREGILFDPDWRGDTGRGAVVAISHSIEFEPPQKLNPYRIRMSASLNGGPTYAVGDASDHNTSRVVMCCVSSTLVEEPIFGS